LDPIGRKTLELLSGVESYNEWTFEIIEPFIGNVIFEAGCGKGTFTSRFLKKGKVVACDISVDYLKEVEETYKDNPNLINTVKWNLHDTSGLQKLSKINFDTIVCLDVLEHIKEDSNVLINFNRLLSVGGILILKVPAVKAIYGTLDEHLGHYLRYSKKEIRTKVLQHGFEVLKLRYLNIIGIFGWYLNGVILKKSIIPITHLRMYERLVPFLKFIEGIIPPPLGQSLFLICRKRTSVV
jgi:SAM-dependent methyltransferase